MKSLCIPLANLLYDYDYRFSALSIHQVHSDHPVAINPPCREFKGASGKKALEDSVANLKSSDGI